MPHLEVRHLLQGRRLFQCGYPKVWRLLEEIRYWLWTSKCYLEKQYNKWTRTLLFLNFTNASTLRFFRRYPVSIYLFRVNYWNTRTMREIGSKLTIKTPERGQWRRSGIFIANFEQFSHIVLVFSLLALNK